VIARDLGIVEGGTVLKQ